MLYDAVSMIHDVITTANPFPYIAKFMLIDVKKNKKKLNKSNIERRIEYVGLHSVVVYHKYLTRWEIINFQTSLDIFDIRQHYVRIPFSSLSQTSPGFYVSAVQVF